MEMITTVMRDYSRSSSKIECSVLDAILEYLLKAHKVYNHALCLWLERNSKSIAREKAKKSIGNYPKREKESLQRYYKRACRELDDRSMESSSGLSRLGSPARSGVSALSFRTLEEQQHMAIIKLQVNVYKKNVAEYRNPFTWKPAFTRPRERNDKVPETSRGAFVYN